MKNTHIGNDGILEKMKIFPGGTTFQVEKTTLLLIKILCCFSIANLLYHCLCVPWHPLSPNNTWDASAGRAQHACIASHSLFPTAVDDDPNKFLTDFFIILPRVQRWTCVYLDIWIKSALCTLPNFYFLKPVRIPYRLKNSYISVLRTMYSILRPILLVI